MLLPENPNAFTRSPLDRAGHLRRDEEWLAQAARAETSKFIPFHKHRPFVLDDAATAALGWLGAHALAALDVRISLFLGLDRNETAHFAIDIANPTPIEALGRFDDLRSFGAILPRADLPLLGAAKSVFEWHSRHGFCAHCGQPSVIAEAGWKRACPACKAEHFPRVDPVVIMLPVYGQKCLLGRQRSWPRGMHSALAGFIEPGEAIEEAVARETFEEAGLRVRVVRLHSTQPWPFPHSLMIGAIAEVENDNERIDGHE